MDLNNKTTILITCGPSLEEYLQGEVEGLGYVVNSSHHGGVEITGTLDDCMRLNLHLRTAYNVLYLLRKFKCLQPDQLYYNVSQIEWEDIIPVDEYLSIVTRVNTPSIDNTMYAGMKTKDAIVDRIMQETGKRPNSGKERNNLVFNLYWKDDRAWLYLNTSGKKLSDRNYRKIPFIAPMRESLAAAVVTETGYDGTAAFVNPMCGSGTLAIEAALLACERPAGSLRGNFGFMHLKGFDDEKWQAIRREATKSKRQRKNAPVIAPIIATDISEGAINIARRSAITAGVDHLIDFQVCDFADTPVPEGEGVVILNPGYGERMGEESELETTYKKIGDFFKQSCKGYTGYIFTGNPKLGKKVGLRTSKRTIFFTGKIECRLLKYELYGGTRKNI
ncbi:MAG TPA: class I SAM-dependent RNA methyltransferase [Phycisphaerales bacterium]|nr:class I SAM-dependent RNA methyltransferase [Phycisphaerales bacterium]